MPDAYVIGAGPNGLAAAVTLARAGLRVHVCEAAPQIGGGLRSRELTLPGFVHDEFSAVHPLALTSPFFTAWGITARVEFSVPDVAFAHPLGATSVRAHRDLAATLDELTERHSPAAARTYRRLVAPLARDLPALLPLILDAPVAARPTPARLAAGLRFGAAVAELSARLGAAEWGELGLGGSGPLQRGSRAGAAPALAALAGCVAHAVSPLGNPAAVAAGLVLAASAHGGGWPMPLGGAQSIADALAADLLAHGGTLEVGRHIAHLDDLDGLGGSGPDPLVIADVPLRQAAAWVDQGAHPTRPHGTRPTGATPGDTPAGAREREAYRRTVARVRPGNAAARVDYAVNAPIPWRDPSVAAAATVHLGGAAGRIGNFERNLARGRLTRDPYVLLAQPSLFDPSRAPAGQHTVWAYTHAPNGATLDPTEAVTRTIERYAPGFRDTILASRAASPADLGHANPNLVGGDLAMGAITLRQLLARPALTANPWGTPRRGLYVCSAATSPGPGVHGMNGYLAARAALRERGLADPFARV
ncbi:NAD(P)/FAD-dependent oxidoreductase [Micrococcales bacterium 31B]|nr:NAD(P)/FAD-dependent oxidoreductase [Micrococcales bacterium 31B]